MAQRENPSVQQSLRQWLRRTLPFFKASEQAVQPALDESTLARLDALPVPVAPANQPLSQQPLVVFDLETSGLNIQKDVVLSIGAVRIEHQSIVLGRPMEAVLRVDTPLQADSQLIHGLTRADLAQGQDPRLALLQLLELGQDAVWLAFHSAFDHAMLQRAAARWLGLTASRIPVPLDLAYLAPMLFPQYAKPQAGLDHWLQCFALDMPARHHAAADAFVTAQIGLVVLAKAQQKGYQTWGELAQALQAWRREREQQAQREMPGF